MKYRSFFVLGMLASPAIACSTENALDIGANVGSKLSDYSGTWDGYAEAYQWSDGSDRIRLTLDGNGQGTLRVGDRPLYAAPTDPTIGYPTEESWVDFFVNIAIRATVIMPGVAYPVHETRLDGNRIRLDIDPFDLWRPWCQMQRSFTYDPNTYPQYSCVPVGTTQGINGGGNCVQPDPVTGAQSPVDCRKVDLCLEPVVGMGRSVCDCDASSCTTPQPPNTLRYPLDASLQMTGSELVGTLVAGPRTTIRMTRQ